MIEAIRQALARRAVRSALAARRSRPLPPLSDRRVLVVLPDGAAGQRATWALLETLAVPPARVRPVLLAPLAADPPTAFADGLRLLADDDRDRLGLPSAAVRAAIWSPPPDVALNLADPDDLGAALLVGASPAAVRVGRHHADREPFYDLMVQGEPDAASAARAVGRLLDRLNQTVLPTR
ncbi:hypothetical protein [Rubrivirga sp.]|uniref:hypothetical protein n=1 Tax=Rubrivirga sp. TaxID=1885344 RepID=UPI003B5242B1